jgi:hypothetical protein
MIFSFDYFLNGGDKQLLLSSSPSQAHSKQINYIYEQPNIFFYIIFFRNCNGGS